MLKANEMLRVVEEVVAPFAKVRPVDLAVLHVSCLFLSKRYRNPDTEVESELINGRS